MTEIHWATQSSYPVLATLQLLPLVAVLLIWCLRDKRYLFLLGTGLASLELLLALDLYSRYDITLHALQFSEQLNLPGPFAYHAGADGITVLFVLLNALLTLLVLIYGQVRDLRPLPLLFSIIFIVESLLMSLLVSVDLMWFVLVSAVQLLPVGFLIWRWAPSPEKALALTRFYQFMGIGVMLLLFGTLILGWNYANVTGSGWSFDLMDLAGVKVSGQIDSVVFFLLFYGFAIRTPLFPLHGWLPVTAEHGSIALAPVFLLGLKIGIYGLLRFVFPLLPEAVFQWHQFVMAFAVIGIFYAALMALLQVNLRRLLAFAVVSHTSILVIGLFSLGEHGFEGSVILSVNLGLAITGLVFVIGLIYKRTRTMLFTRLGGLFDKLPLLGIAFLVAGLSIIGMPGTPGFDAVHLVLEDAMHRFGALVTIAAALGNVVAAGFLLWTFQRAFLAPVENASQVSEVKRATGLEKLIAVMVITILLGSGFYSEPWLELVESSTQDLNEIFVQIEGSGR
ncbi:MAG: NADH-quinone oxidoreductase subunit M [Gammaproteobacteria bacterium]|nr:NADH-quinone oxidoreductase subunit M [Gammaproteobacteria bacterium]